MSKKKSKKVKRSEKAAPSAASGTLPPAVESEEAFLARYDLSAFERPSVAVDVVLLTTRPGGLAASLIPRREHPHRGRWALPGGFVGMEETLEEAARRIVRDKIGVGHLFVEQLFTFGALERDPRGRVISVAYYGLVNHDRLVHDKQDDVVVAELDIPWPGETGGPLDARFGMKPLALAFDHADILGMAVKRIRGKLDYTPVGFQLLGDQFTLRQLQDVHEAVRSEPLNKDSFRRRMLATGHLEATGERERETHHRPAELYRFVKRSAV